MGHEVISLTRPRKDALSAIQAAATVVPSVHLLELMLTGARFELKPMSCSEPVDIKAKTHSEKRGSKLVTRVEYTLEGVSPRTDDETVSVVASYLLTYDLRTEVEEDAMACFGAINGIFNSWAYWRELVASAASRLGLPPLTLHLLTPPQAARYAGFASAKKKPSSRS